MIAGFSHDQKPADDQQLSRSSRHSQKSGSPDFIRVGVNLYQGLFGAGFRAMLISVRNHLGDLLRSKAKFSQTLFYPSFRVLRRKFPEGGNI